jgi:hypothetical protein
MASISAPRPLSRQTNKRVSEKRKGSEGGCCKLSNLFLVLFGIAAGMLVGFNMIVEHWGSDMDMAASTPSSIMQNLRQSFVTRPGDKIDSEAFKGGNGKQDPNKSASEWDAVKERIKQTFVQRAEQAHNHEEGASAEDLVQNPKQQPQQNAQSQSKGPAVADDPNHEIAGLSCKIYGGPDDEFAQKEMVYWRDIASDSLYESPFRKDHKMNDEEPKYLTFEPDGGGWNNIRMALETVVALAHAMGRTLVLPPEQGFYLLRKDRSKNKINFSFNDFFHMESLSQEHNGLDIITMEEFLKREAITGHLKNTTSGEVSFPPDMQADWNGKDVKDLKEYLRNVTHWRNWNTGRCMAAFPADTGPEHVQELHGMMQEIEQSGGTPAAEHYKDNPTPVDAPAVSRLKENLSGRSELCIYDEEMQSAPVVHFLCYHKIRARLLTHFYTFLFFEDWKQDLFYKRFMRDHFRYLDEIQCASARVVEAVRNRARERDPTGNPNGEFDTFHVRRGDFQFKHTRVDADVLYENSADKLTKGATIYIATDERNKDFFKPLAEHYDLCYLDDFKHLLPEINTNYYGMLDQIIAAKGRVFFGTWHSTFTGYINRMRGYHATKEFLPGYEMGVMESYYFVPPLQKDAMKHYMPIHGAHFNREFPTAWRDIDRGIDELHIASEA